jgi:hypothetical protein
VCDTHFISQIKHPIKEGKHDHGYGIEIAFVGQILFCADAELAEIFDIASDIL